MFGGGLVATAAGYSLFPRLVSFDVLAPHYRWMEFVLAGEKLQRCRTAFLAQAAGVERVLILGEGNGRFLAACRQALPMTSVTCVDASARMLGLARGRLRRRELDASRIEFVNVDALDWSPPANTFDLIVTHFFLDCFAPNELGTLIAKLAQAARPKAMWLLADFQVPSAGLARVRAQVIHRIMYGFFRSATGLSARRLTSPDSFLMAQHFALRERRLSEWGLLRSDWWARGLAA